MDKNLLKSKIIELLVNKPLRSDLTKKAGKIVVENHDATKIREQFRQVLTEAASM